MGRYCKKSLLCLDIRDMIAFLLYGSSLTYHTANYMGKLKPCCQSFMARVASHYLKDAPRHLYILLAKGSLEVQICWLSEDMVERPFNLQVVRLSWYRCRCKRRHCMRLSSVTGRWSSVGLIWRWGHRTKDIVANRELRKLALKGYDSAKNSHQECVGGNVQQRPCGHSSTPVSSTEYLKNSSIACCGRVNRHLETIWGCWDWVSRFCLVSQSALILNKF